jgi:hypothetical protein
MAEHFFKKYYSDVEYLNCVTRAEKFVNLINDQSLFLAVGVGWGANVRLFQKAGWAGRIVGFDEWKRVARPTDLDPAHLIEGDVRDTLETSLTELGAISLLSIDLDGDVDASILTLDLCRSRLTDQSYIYIDEFYGFENWQNGIANHVATWLALNLDSYDIAFYTDNRLALKVGGPHTADKLMLNLLEFTTENF